MWARYALHIRQSRRVSFSWIKAQLNQRQLATTARGEVLSQQDRNTLYRQQYGGK